jgi:hypothetical protein
MSQTKAQLLGPVLGDVNYDSGTLFVDATNARVGIGTTSPLTTLTVKTTSDNSTKTLRITDGVGLMNIGHWDGVHNRIEFGDKPNLIIGYGDGNYLALGTGGEQRLHITSTGNVGIGTTDPQQKLHVVSTSRSAEFGTTDPVNIIKIYNSNTGRTTYNGLDIKVNSTTNGIFNFYGGDLSFGTSNTNGVDATEKVRVTQDGYLKLSGRNVQGTANGDKLLRIYQPSRTDAEEDVIILQTYNTETANDLKIGGGDSSFNSVTRITLRTSASVNTTTGTDRLIIKNDGNVGIGKDDPSSKLSVVGNFAISDNNTFERTIFSTSSSGFVLNHTDNSSILLQTQGSTHVTIEDSGDVSIGQSPAGNWRLIVKGEGTNNTLFKSDNANGAYTAYDLGASGATLGYIGAGNQLGTGVSTDFALRAQTEMALLTGGANERVRIDNVGNVGIGETNPTVKLQVKYDNTNTFSSSTSANPTLLLYNGSNQTGSYATLQFRTSNSNGAASIFSIGNVASSTNYQGTFVIQARTDASEYKQLVNINGATGRYYESPGNYYYTRAKDLSSQVQQTSFRRSVIACCDVTNSPIDANSWSHGRIIFHRSNSLHIDGWVDYIMGKKYNVAAPLVMWVVYGFTVDIIRPVTFTYNSVKYGGFHFYYAAANNDTVWWHGEGNFDVFGLDYYNTQTNTAIYSEVNNSLNFSDYYANTNFLVNNNAMTIP